MCDRISCEQCFTKILEKFFENFTKKREILKMNNFLKNKLSLTTQQKIFEN